MSAAVDLQGLTKLYGGVAAVDDLWLRVEPGQIVGFLGPNGAGKTTTLRMLTGLLKPTRGVALVAGHDIVRDAIEAKRRIGYVPDGPYLYEKLTGREFLEFVAGLYGVPQAVARRRSGDLLALFDMEEKAGEMIEGYSHGMRQKLGVVAALQHDPTVLFLDEPTGGLDPRSARALKDLLLAMAREGRTVMLSTHVLEIAEQMCDRLAIIDHGRLIAEGTMAELRRGGTASLEDLFLRLTGSADPDAATVPIGD